MIVWGGAGDLTSGIAHYQTALGCLELRAALAAPCNPRTKDKIECFFSFVQRDFLSEHRGQKRDLGDLNRELERPLHFYHQCRPHASLRGDAPGQHYRGSQRAALQELESLSPVETS